MFNSLQNSTLVQSYNLNDHLSADDTHSMYSLWPPPDTDCSLNQFRDCILDSFHWMIESSYIHARMHACYIHKCMHAYTHARRNARTQERTHARTHAHIYTYIQRKKFLRYQFVECQKAYKNQLLSCYKPPSERHVP